jgi:transcriptional regulator with XRE-family HTH domain
MSVFGDYVRSRREELGLSQREAAKRLGVSANTIARWETGTALPTSERVGPLRDLLGISRSRIDDLIGGTAPPPGAEVLAARIAELEDRIAELEAKCAEPVTTLEDQNGNSITLGPAGITIQSSARLELQVSSVQASAGLMQLLSGMVSVSGVLKADTVITNSVIASSYTPGAGNVS